MGPESPGVGVTAPGGEVEVTEAAGVVPTPGMSDRSPLLNSQLLTPLCCNGVKTKSSVLASPNNNTNRANTEDARIQVNELYRGFSTMRRLGKTVMMGEAPGTTADSRARARAAADGKRASGLLASATRTTISS